MGNLGRIKGRRIKKWYFNFHNFRLNYHNCAFWKVLFTVNVKLPALLKIPTAVKAAGLMLPC